MKNSFKIRYDEIRTTTLRSVFEAFERAFINIGIDFYVIGALARDYWFSKQNIETKGTKDIDIAIQIADNLKFEAIKEYLVASEGFTIHSENPILVFDAHGIQIDLLPFGAVEQDGKVFLNSRAFPEIDVVGIKEVFERGVIKVNENGLVFKLAKLEGIVILKFIAFNDRPEDRGKDIVDIGMILKNYFDIASDDIYDFHQDLFDEDLGIEYIAARVLGREMRNILALSQALDNRIQTIIEDEIILSQESYMLRILVTQIPNTNISFWKEILDELLRGIREIS
ncbi:MULTISPECIES: nucleotidyl transferase AbiEii/AbiGii toxin family protein [unclassified Arcicella]|uniref:nucleotidyl transferase AbiEii/AbiGii toxin family protein n=1 Tax=unclassified Arcicella TaxID=2644986 RepID=UPI002859F42A|nr:MULTISPECIES: nucleotidyl transferase AbiEii/AbiGii toxin family protein [unclassified Arcicella]MDR6562818.1 putative nucleotidyltransferase [Arcicella sp. BE51]MDR6812840.1 putative nucleotidyltransferase [Arcicella sp. BE140]MDR6824152.1 putative nucleotidyltransferase [Arcicella sp. BE139]